MSNEMRGYITATYDVKTNEITFDYTQNGVCSEYCIGFYTTYDNKQAFADSFKDGELCWRNEANFTSKVDCYHSIYKQYIRCCKKGLLQKNPTFNKYITKFYADLASGMYSDEIDDDEAQELIEEFRKILLFK